MEGINKARDESTDSGVGVLGWLGFVIINFAAWGIIGVSTVLAWPLGFTFTLIYTGLLMSLAACLPRYGSRYRSFENLLWVLGCIFVFVVGLYLSVNVVGPAFDEDISDNGNYNPNIDNDLTKLLPKGSNSELTSWATASPPWSEIRNPTFITFEGNVFFGGNSAALTTNDGYDEILLKSDGATTAKITPEIANFRTFVKFNSNIYFLGQSGDHALWQITPTTAASNEATIVKKFGMANGGWVSVEELTVIDGKMWMKVSQDCQIGHVETVYKSDGTSSGTVDLRGDSCMKDTDSGNNGNNGNQGSEKPTAILWSVLFLAVVPQLAVAGGILAWKKMPGLFMNLYIGVAAAATLIYIIADDVGEGLSTFLKWFITIYTSIGYVVITLVSLRFDPLPELLEQMKDWIVVFVGIPFFVVIHIDLNLPFDANAGEWILYAFLAVVQMIVSIAVQRSLPMVLGAIATFVVAWKISREIVRSIFSDEMNETALLVTLGLMALQGIAIIGGAIVYATKRKDIENAVRKSLDRCFKKNNPE